MKPIEPGDIVICVEKYGDAHKNEAFRAEKRYADTDYNSGWYWSCECHNGNFIPGIPETLLVAVTIPGIQDAWEHWHTSEHDFLHLLAEFLKRPAEEQIVELEKSLDTDLKRMEMNYAENKLRTIKYYAEWIEALKKETES